MFERVPRRAAQVTAVSMIAALGAGGFASAQSTTPSGPTATASAKRAQSTNHRSTSHRDERRDRRGSSHHRSSNHTAAERRADNTPHERRDARADARESRLDP